jgi:glycosyltransferase involved in cell wall biosynthesis
VTIICINAVSVREGGSLVVLKELLAGMQHLRPEWKWVVATNDVALAGLPELKQVSWQVYSSRILVGWRIFWWYQRELPRLLRESGADILFSQTNYLPWRQLDCPALLLEQHAGHFSSVFKALLLEQGGLLARLTWFLKGGWVRRSLTAATHVTVQTQALREAIIQEVGIPAARISVIPHGCGLLESAPKVVALPEAGHPVRLGYITKYGVQKNFGVLFAAAAGLLNSGFDLRLVLTLDASSRQGQEVLAQASQLGVIDIVENHGELAAADISALYRNLHVFVFPSLCESFGFPLVEAMAAGLPLLIAATPSNLEVAGNGGLAFPPHDAAILADLLRDLLTSPARYEQQATLARLRASSFSWQQAAAGTIALIERLLYKQEAG